MQSSRRGLRSADSHQLVVEPSKLVSAGGRSFPVLAATLWNSLPAEVVSTESTDVFRVRIKTFLFKLSYPKILF